MERGPVDLTLSWKPPKKGKVCVGLCDAFKIWLKNKRKNFRPFTDKYSRPAYFQPMAEPSHNWIIQSTGLGRVPPQTKISQMRILE